MSQGFNQPPGGEFGSSSGGFSGGQSGFGGGFGSGGFGGGSSGQSAGSSFGESSGGFNQGPSGSFSSATPVGPQGGRRGRSKLTSAPVEWILPGLVLGIISLGLNGWITFGSLVATDDTFAIVAGIAWALAGIFGILSIGKYLAAVNEAKSSGFFTDIAWKRVLFRIAAVILLVAVIWSAVDIALWAGKQSW